MGAPKPCRGCQSVSDEVCIFHHFVDILTVYNFECQHWNLVPLRNIISETGALVYLPAPRLIFKQNLKMSQLFVCSDKILQKDSIRIHLSVTGNEYYACMYIGMYWRAWNKW
jgi:hypothetical protein